MSCLLDTNILSEHLRRPAGLTHRFVPHSGRLDTSRVATDQVCVAGLIDHQTFRRGGRSDDATCLA